MRPSRCGTDGERIRSGAKAPFILARLRGALKRRSSTMTRASEDETFFEEQIPRGWSQIGKTHDRGLLAYFRFWSKKSRIIV